MTSSEKSPTSLVEISISCRNLRKTDNFSDPMCIVYHQPFSTQKWIELKQTECMTNTFNPEFTTKIPMNFYFEEQQPIKFSLVNTNSKNTNAAEKDSIGEYQCTLAQLVGFEVEEPLANKNYDNNGSITINIEELSSSKEELHIQFSGKSLENSHEAATGTTSTYLEIFKSNESGTFSVVSLTEKAKDTRNPDYKELSIPLRKLCNGDYDVMLKVVCKELVSSGNHKEIGTLYTTVRKLLITAGPSKENTYTLFNQEEQKTKGSSNKGRGQIVVNRAHIKQEVSFIDYIKGGTDINAVIAIDYTVSNRNPQDERSLHFNNTKFPNQYSSAIQAVGTIIEEYDTDKLFPVLGFGAKLPPDYRNASHNFHVNGNRTDPNCHQVKGVIDAYYASLTRVRLSGPTNFSPIINHVARIAKSSIKEDKYFILLIITDGIITDMPLTKEAIVNASELPLSIIIVGVGDADFDAMQELDGDDERLSSIGRSAARDIVQFVAYRDFTEDGDCNKDTARMKLAREVLAEVPDQFMSYMRDNNIAPQTPRLCSCKDISNYRRVKSMRFKH